MAFSLSLLSLPLPLASSAAANRPASLLCLGRASISALLPRRRNSKLFSTSRKTLCGASAEVHESGGASAADGFPNVKHLLLPITDWNPYLSEGTRQISLYNEKLCVSGRITLCDFLFSEARQLGDGVISIAGYAAAATTALAKKYGADITVVVINDKLKESIPEHETQLSSIRWHLSEGGFQEFGLMEKLGEGKKPTAIIGEVADELNLDLVVLSMEAIHSKHVDANLLAEFIPCPVLLLPL